MSIDSNDAQELVSMLSQERLTALLAISTSSIEAIKLHQETLKLGASLMVVIATIEIVLRNSVCKQLDAHFGVPNWLQQPPVPFRWRDPEHKNVAKANDAARRSEYSKLTQQQKHLLDTIAYPSGRPQNKSHLDRAKDRRKNIEVSNGKVIAELTFYFWKRLFGPEYEQSLWKPVLKRVFPNKKLKRSDIAIKLEIIYQTRNRLAHHEPVIGNRFDDSMQAIEFVIQNIGTKIPNSSTPLSKLLAAEIIEIKKQANVLHAQFESLRNTPSHTGQGSE